MAPEQTRTYFTPEEYLDLELKAEHKSEYWNGDMVAMPGASARHVQIVTNIVGELHGQLRKRPCHLYASDLRLRVTPTGLYTYPDVMVVCGESIFAENQRDTLLNPTVILEVLSQSTQDYDRGAKFEHFRTLESLREYVLVAQDRPHIEHCARQPDNRWLLSETNRIEDTVHLVSIACELPLIEIYDKVDLVRS